MIRCIPGPFGYGDSQPADYPENVVEVFGAQAGAVEIVDSKQQITVLCKQRIEREVGCVPPVKEAGRRRCQAGFA